MSTKTFFTYKCPFVGCKSKYVSPIELADFPQCNGKHQKTMDFIEKLSTGVPNHIKNDKKIKPQSRYSDDRKVGGGNWVND